MKTLYDSISAWLEQFKKNSVKAATYDRLITSLKSLSRYPIARKNVSTLRSDDLQDYVNSMVDDGYALSTIRKQYHLVSAFLQYAYVEGIILRPIHNTVKLPAQSSVKKQKRVVEGYSDEEQRRLVAVLRRREHPGYAVALLMLETGMRVGEALALDWDDVIWNRRAIRINKTLIRLANRKRMEVQTGAKSYTSNRTIPLSREAMNLLNALRDELEWRDGYIFSGDDGKPMSYEALRYQIQSACREANVPYKGQHVFRHTFATNCYYRGCNVKILSKLLGHADVAITYNTYIHLFGDALEEMRNVIG